MIKSSHSPPSPKVLTLEHSPLLVIIYFLFSLLTCLWWRPYYVFSSLRVAINMSAFPVTVFPQPIFILWMKDVRETSRNWGIVVGKVSKHVVKGHVKTLQMSLETQHQNSCLTVLTFKLSVTSCPWNYHTIAIMFQFMNLLSHKYTLARTLFHFLNKQLSWSCDYPWKLENSF